MGLWERFKGAIQIVVGGQSQGRAIVKGATVNSGATRPKQGEEWLQAYNTMPWLSAGTRKIAHGVASLQWGITRTMDASGMTVKRIDIQKGTVDYRRKALAALAEEGKAEAVFDHPFLTLWKNPCPALPGGAARKLAQVYYEVVGEAFFVIDRGPRDAWIKSDFSGRPLPTALWPIPPHWVKRVPTPDNPTFEIRHVGLQMNDIPLTEVLWLKDPDPMNPYSRGVGAYNALKDELETDENAAQMLSYSFYNRNRPDVLISIPNASKEEIDAFRNNWISNLQGVQNALKSHFVNVEAKVEQIGFDFREMQVAELRKATRDTIRQVPGIPPEILGIQDQSNRSTIEAAEYIFNKHVIEPRAEMWREFLESQVLIEYDPRAVLDYVAPSQDDKEFSLKVIQRQPEFFQVNEIRKMAGQPALLEADGGKMFFVNGQFVPSLTQAPPPPGAAGAPGSAPPPGSGGGLPHPGFEGGINVPGHPTMHLSVPGAPGSPESGQPAPPHPSPALAISVPGLPKGITKGGARLAGRFHSPLADARVPIDVAKAIGAWARVCGHTVEVAKALDPTPIPISDDRKVEYLRRGLAYMNGTTTKGWDRMFGRWTADDSEMLDRLIGVKSWEEPDPGVVVKGDVAGHEFHGNQYTNGGGGEGPLQKTDDHAAFIEARDKSTRSGFLSPLTPEDMQARDVYMNADRTVGFTLTKDDKDFGNLFNTSSTKGAGREAIIQGIKLGARTLDCFDGFLPGLYSKYGFVETARLKFDPEQAPKGWQKDPDLAKRPDVVFMAYRGGDRQTIQDRVGSFPPKTEAPRVKTYDAAKASQERALRDPMDVFTRQNRADKLRAIRAARRPMDTFTEQNRADKLRAMREARGKGITKGDVPGHEFHGNQYTDGAAGGEDEGNGRQSVRAIEAETTTKVKDAFHPYVDKDADGDGVTDAARVGVPAKEVPPPPTVPRLPNLTPQERAAESAFADAYQKDPDGMANKLLEGIRADPPPTFETDAAKNLFAAWKGEGMSPEDRAQVRSTLNTALHQTANAVTKRAFLKHLDEMTDADKAKGILVTVGGCGAGKGFALKTLAGQGYQDFNKRLYGAVWDSAGDQNATENPWILDEAEKRGIKVTYAYISSDPEVAWADPERGVVQRAGDPKDGRMVDASVFADSYVLGAKNHAAFSERNKNRARFVYVRNGSKIEKLDSVPDSDLKRDRKVLREFAVKTIEARKKLAPRIRRGALTGARIWK